MSDRDEVRAFITDPALQRRLAKYLVLQCFRNSILEISTPAHLRLLHLGTTRMLRSPVLTVSFPGPKCRV